MSSKYDTLVTAVNGFIDQLEAETLRASKERHQARVLLRQMFPELSPEEVSMRLRQFDARAEELARTTARLRALLTHVVSGGSTE